MPNNSSIKNEARSLIQDSQITLYQISGSASALASAWSGDLYLVSPEQSGGNKVEYANLDGDLVTYLPVPIAAAGFSISGSNSLPQPKVQISNIDGQMTLYNLDFEDLIGFSLTRIRTYAKYLSSIDGVSTGTYDGNAHFTPDTWWFQRKETETKQGVTYELASVFDLEGLKLPKRRMYSNYCPFEYRGPDCLYGGPAVSSPDICPKHLGACQARFGAQGLPLRFGGFPATTDR
jgi:lambda family phage minor tail protein L